MEERVSSRPLCQHITMQGAGLPCATPAVYWCSKCQAKVCGQHVRWGRKHALDLFDESFCPSCWSQLPATQQRGR